MTIVIIIAMYLMIEKNNCLICGPKVSKVTNLLGTPELQRQTLISA